MTDYSQFPFEIYTMDELAQMLIGSVECGDDEFADALRERIKKRKPDEQLQPVEEA